MTDNDGMSPISTDDPERESVEGARDDRVADESLAEEELWGYWGNGLGEWVRLRPARSRPALRTAATAAKS